MFTTSTRKSPVTVEAETVSAKLRTAAGTNSDSLCGNFSYNLTHSTSSASADEAKLANVTNEL